MAARSAIPRLTDIVEAIGRVRIIVAGVTLEAFEADRDKRWLVEGGLEIISEASRHLPSALKNRHPKIPWRKIAGIGNILRHEYERIAAAVLCKVAQDELVPLEQACGAELRRALEQESPRAERKRSPKRRR